MAVKTRRYKSCMVNLLSTLRALAGLLDINHELLESIARAWIATGATFFGVWFQDELVVGWPNEVVPDGDTIKATLRLNGVVAEIRVYGLPAHEFQARLTADASLVVQITALEAELNSMTQE